MFERLITKRTVIFVLMFVMCFDALLFYGVEYDQDSSHYPFCWSTIAGFLFLGYFL